MAEAPTAPAWTPSTPPARLVRSPVLDAPRWRAWLSSQGYGPDEIATRLPELVEAAELRVAALERAGAEADGTTPEAAEVAQARAGAVRAHLADHPPGRVLEADQRPVAHLDPAAFGGRLVQVGTEGTRQVLEDLITGRRWWTVGEAGARAGLAVVAGALYRLVDVAAPAARLAELEGERVAVHPEPVAWEPMAGAVLELHGDRLRAELPADAWLGYRGGLPGLRGRAHVMPRGMASTLRLALGSTLGRAAGRKAPTWGETVPELGELLGSRPWAGADVRTMDQTARRLARVTDRQIRQVVDLGQLEGPEAARLVAVLVARREQVGLELQALRG